MGLRRSASWIGTIAIAVALAVFAIGSVVLRQPQEMRTFRIDLPDVAFVVEEHWVPAIDRNRFEGSHSRVVVQRREMYFFREGTSEPQRTPRRMSQRGTVPPIDG